jgi:translation initiation factor 2 beta subunit (eIF-2beta)/eIF-5
MGRGFEIVAEKQVHGRRIVTIQLKCERCGQLDERMEKTMTGTTRLMFTGRFTCSKCGHDQPVAELSL